VQIISAGKDGIWGRGQQKDGYAIFAGDPTQTENQYKNSGSGANPSKTPYTYVNGQVGGGDDYTNFTQTTMANPQ
jgi:hypothetical protein